MFNFRRRSAQTEKAPAAPFPDDAMGVARELSLTGWVRNERDGSVTAEIQGSAAHVGAFFSRMLEAYRRYPISYTVDEREDIPLVPDETEFEVRY